MTHRALAIFLVIFISIQGISSAQHLRLEVETNNQPDDSIAKIYLPQREYESPQDLKNTLDKFRELLYQAGYLQSTIQNTTQSDSIYKVKFFSGKRVKLVKLKYNTQHILEYAKVLKLNIDSTHLYIRPRELQSTLEAFVNIDLRKGRPFSSYALKHINLSQDTAFAELNVSNNQTQKLNAIVIKGYEKFPKSFLKHFAKLRTNTLYSEEKVIQSTSYLNELNFIKQIKQPDILFKNDSTTLYLYLEKESSNQFEGFLGFANRENTNGLRINGYLNLKLNNTLNYGEYLQIQFRGNGDDQQQLDASLRMPYIFKSPLSITPSLKLFRQDSSFSNSQTQLKIDYTWSPKFLVNAQLGQLKSNRLEAEPLAAIENFTKTILSTGFELTGDNSTKAPFEYNYLSFNGGYAIRKIETQATSQQQLLLNSESSYTFDLNTKHKFYLKNTTAYISPKRLLENELHRFGGMQTIRGYKENNFYASFFSTLQTEYRFKPQNNIIINSVLDAAYYENSISKQSELLFGVGLGGSILTQAGWLRINIAAPVSQNNSFETSNTVLHISLLNIF